MLQTKQMKIQISAGGVVYKREKGDLYILVSQHSGHHGWVFPKGLIGDKVENEDKETTALREVREETGVNGKIIQPLKPVVFWFVMDGVKIKKTVHYFLMEYVSGEITDHDWEMENVEWLEESKILERLTYPSDKKVWLEAQKLLS